MLPQLIHPVQVTVEVLDQAQEVMDTDAREPIHGARSASGDIVVIPAQISLQEFQTPQAHTGGIRTRTTGYILCRVQDMDEILGAIGLTDKRFKLGDHITQWVGQDGHVVPCDLYVTQRQPCAHYPDHGATMYKFHVEDRDPVI